LQTSPKRRWLEPALAWYFVAVWGSGFVATKIGLAHAPPFTFLSLRFAFGLACLVPIALIARPRWPGSAGELKHVVIAGLLMHAIHLGGSHYTQYLGMSAGITAVLLSIQPLITAMIAARWMGEPLTRSQWVGIVIGLAGVVLVVWHKVDAREAGLGSLIAVSISLIGVTAGTLYQRTFCPLVDLRAAAVIQFACTLIVLLPLAWLVEDHTIQWSWSLAGAVLFLVIGASILGVNALHTLMRRGQAARVASLIYLTPVFAVAPEFLIFGIAPTPLSLAGIAVTTLGVALAMRRSGKPITGTPGQET
jgi:drug/metabolite transporter (DMT)-like permease